MSMKKWLLLGLALHSMARAEFPARLMVTPISSPRPARIDRQPVLVYELILSNLGEDYSLTGLEVWDENGRLLRTWSSDELTRACHPRRLDGRLPTAAVVTLLLWVPLDSGPPPQKLTHRLELGTDSLQIDEIPVLASSQLELALPLNRKGRWLALNGPSNSGRHRRSFSADRGTAYLSQRFAVDWVLLDQQERRFRGDALDNSSYYAYGADVLAVADGTVCEVYDGLPDNQPGSRPQQLRPETMAGNSVALDLGQGQVAHYGHLAPDSIVVRPGDKVRRGQRLARVGNSGNSTEPHLHFHVSGPGSWLYSDGLPYRFEHFRVEGQEDHFGDLMSENQKILLP